MAMKKRERILAGVTGALVVVVGGAYLFRGGGKSLSDLRTDRETLQGELQRLTLQAKPGKKATAQLNLLRKRSLPTDYKVAGEKYKNWLSLLAVDKLQKPDIQTLTVQTNRGVYTVLPFRIEAKATLDELTRFLFDFYSTDYLHKIRQLTSTPAKGSQELKVTIVVEALCLNGAVAKDKLPEAKSKRLDHGTLDDYLQAIVRRRMEGKRYVPSGGLFASYAPEPPPPPKVPTGPVGPTPPTPPRFDPSAFTYVNAIHEVDGRPEVWLYVRTEGKTLVRHEGDPFEVGTIRGTIRRIHIEQLNMEIELDDGRRFRVDFGDSLQNRVELPKETASAAVRP